MKNREQQLEKKLKNLEKRAETAFKNRRVVDGVRLSEKATQTARELYNLQNPDKPIL